jgi:hypothetical protein
LVTCWLLIRRGYRNGCAAGSSFALGDEDEQLRWLAALSSQGIGGRRVIATLKAFIDQTPSPVPPQGVTSSRGWRRKKCWGS